MGRVVVVMGVAAADKLTEGRGDDVSNVLDNLKNEVTIKSVIEKLAEGLKAFIGYGSQGQGIALVIDPLQQLRKGVLLFLKMFLDRLKSDHKHTGIVDRGNALNELRGAVRKVDDEFYKAIQKIDEIQNDNKISGVVDALKNFSSLQSKNNVNDLADGFQQYLTRVLQAVSSKASSHVESLQTSLPSLIKAYGEQNGDITTQIQKVEGDYKKVNRNGRSTTIPDILTSAVHNGTKYLLEQLKKDGYKFSYQSTSNWNGSANDSKIGQIFLGCLPLYYYWLTYLYWKCREKGGEWEGNRINSGPLSAFLSGQGYAKEHLKNQAGKQIAKTAFNGFTEITAQFPTSVTTYFEFFQNLRDTGLEKWKQEPSQPPSATAQTYCLSGLYIVASTYFGHQQHLNAKDSRPPTSIREMLYWLAGLQFSPIYNELQKQVKKHIPDGGLRVADSSKPSTSGSSGPGSASVGDTLTRKDFNEYLTSSCVFAPALLGTIQGDSADTSDEPWLHNLFCNSMNLQYPSGSALFNALANYSYALQFQLYFVYSQCSGAYSYTCGWNECRYGSGVAAAGLTSHLCPKGCSRRGNRHSNGDHSGCKHDDCSSHGSPLQAFLTDKLKGFSRGHPSEPSSHLATCSGVLCHVPMGFTGKLRTDAGGGLNIAYALNPFCGSPSDPLRQLSEKLGCLTKRTPSTLGDLLGFIWHLNGQLFKSRPRMDELAKMLVESVKKHRTPNNVPNFILHILDEMGKNASSISGPYEPTGLSRSLEAMAPTIPFLYHLFMTKERNTLPGVLFDLTKHRHKREAGERGKYNVVHKSHSGSSPISGHRCSEPSGLWSIFQSLNVKPGNGNTDTYETCRNSQCGGYLSPLTHTYGATYSPNFASTYLSWVVYLVEVFNERLHGLLVEFNDINCKDCGPHCSCTKGQHGTTNCSCHSVVSCAGVLPVLYGHGFNFTNAYTLKGVTHGNDPMKRPCQNFDSALSNILKAGAPLHTLLTVIDDFLYMFRVYFFYNLSSFWIMYTSYTSSHTFDSPPPIASRPLAYSQQASQPY
ncbi:uncharacterized protein BcabD6B2_24320 [Babesia caballi]|uniref:Uncharacterized protein n=1 Tax=Babesia caballi TaxID=5871 RepID=A0AAV4LTK7_BABCB|nr:hypothetical protein, conserved [Babesia caballi]